MRWVSDEDYGLIDPEDEEWSDEEWDEEEVPDVNGHDPSNEELIEEAEPVINVCVIARVVTRASAKRRAASTAAASAAAVEEPLGVKPPAKPPKASYPTTEEIVELQNQQRFLKNTPPFDWTDAEIAYMQSRDP